VQASRAVEAGIADAALVFSFDFLSPFVAGGFHALKILNARFPAPYREGETGSIGLGDGAGYAVLTRDTGDFSLTAQSLHNELHHFTANQPDGAGFDACLAPLRTAAGGRRLWLKGHGTGTLEAGRLEVNALTRAFPSSPLTGWKGSLGHTLGSCGLVELAVACAAFREGRTPGTVADTSEASTAMHGDVALTAFDNCAFDGVVCASNAFGGAHAALILTTDV
jgi:3-oxoacyl-(acyl-carrier-protein) synthase